LRPSLRYKAIGMLEFQTFSKSVVTKSPGTRWRAENRGMTWPEWSRERLIVSFAGISSPSLAHNPHRHSNIVHGFQKLQFRRPKSFLKCDEMPTPSPLPKFVLNLGATLPMQTRCNQECRT
jgi:hypothetical protein